MENAPDNVVSVDFSRARLNSKVEPPKKDIPVESVEKRLLFDELIGHGIVSVAFDPRISLVEVPKQHRSLTHMVLNFSYGYRIHDFKYDDDGIRATLTFPEGYFCCFVPWTAIFSLHSDPLQKSSFWPETAPPAPHLTLVDDE